MTQNNGRRAFLKTSAAVGLGWGATYTSLGALAAEPRKGVPGKLPYKTVYNQDDSVLFRRDEPIEPEDVDRMVDQVVEGGADLFLACCNNHKTNYQSEAWEPIWDEYRKHGTVFGLIRDGWLQHAQQAMRLADLGVDYPERVIKRCKQRGIACGVSIRMDDAHYRGPNAVGQSMVNDRLARFYQNRELYLAGADNLKRSSGKWALNYERPEVRAHYLTLIRELVQRYDWDVLDLDFMRHPPFFDRHDLDRHCETMTGFLREISELCRAPGRNVSVMARVPSTPSNCRGLGLDVAAWAKEGLVRGIALGMKNCTGWEAPADAFRSLVGPDIAIYAGTERQAGRTASVHLPSATNEEKSSATSWSREMYRGFTAGHLANGADGVYLFNFFLTSLRQIDVLSEMHSLEQLRGKEKAYRITTYGTTHTEEADLPMQVPVHVPEKHARRFSMLLAAEPKELPAEALVILDRHAVPDDLWLQFNDTPLGHAAQVSDDPEYQRYYSWGNILDETTAAVFKVPSKAIRDGRNDLVFMNEGKPITVLGLVVRVA